MPTPLSDAALVAFALSGSLQTWAMIVNPFFSPVVRLQTEFCHRVIADGPYRFMRHPGYFAMVISVPSSALAIGSWLALIPACGFVFVILRRASLEDKFLRANYEATSTMRITFRGTNSLAASAPEGYSYSRSKHLS